MKIKCLICNKNYTISALGSHIIQKHKIKVSDYLLKYYNIPLSKVPWKSLSIQNMLDMKNEINNTPFKTYLELYQYIYDKTPNIRKLNKIYKYDVAKICICLGVKTNRNLSEEHKRKISESHKGKKLSTEHKKNISNGLLKVPDEIKKERYARISKSNLGKHHSPESILKMIKNRKISKHPFRGKSGFRKDLGHYVRSTWEANFARILNYLNINYEFEPQTFFITKDNGHIVSYTPDFKIKDYFIEVKGYWFDDAKEKFDLFKKQYPKIKIHLIEKQKYERYKNKFKNKINWED